MKIQKGVVSVKGGANVTPSMVNELIGVVQKFQAAMGVLILLKKPTKGMIATAAQSGIWTDEVTGHNFPKIQIITIEELLDGKQPDMPKPLRQSNKATHTHTDTRQGELL